MTVPAGHPLLGSWRLRAWVSVGDDGSEQRPMGDAPEGLLVYAPDGTMTGLMARGGRTPFASGDVTGGTTAEQAEAFATFIAYGGAFAVDGDTVVHTVEQSLFPNWSGSTQRRSWRLDPAGDVLTLTSPPLELAGVVRSQRLTWQRVVR